MTSPGPGPATTFGADQGLEGGRAVQPQGPSPRSHRVRGAGGSSRTSTQGGGERFGAAAITFGWTCPCSAVPSPRAWSSAMGRGARYRDGRRRRGRRRRDGRDPNVGVQSAGLRPRGRGRRHRRASHPVRRTTMRKSRPVGRCRCGATTSSWSTTEATRRSVFASPVSRFRTTQRSRARTSSSRWTRRRARQRASCCRHRPRTTPPHSLNGKRATFEPPRTTAAATWSPGRMDYWWARPGTGQRTPDLSAVIKEIVDRPGWTSGNALVLVITGSGQRTARSFEGRAAGAALLHVDFDVAPPANVAPVVSAGADQARRSRPTRSSTAPPRTTGCRIRRERCRRPGASTVARGASCSAIRRRSTRRRASARPEPTSCG